ncbi:exodeoxyribonuclease V subunit gamma [Rhodoferax lacus]|uniref:RecBCD enzyme subunit RecC n=1 Tax=Rhodoferax lacus TaxID=2184758 RepID=A0A3E1R734_9BURK|nr:exodeoxyribonuclease V subunit gamma [Rhodoferax lacus]RFO95127.1 exodeoxyribonuclease V subunit gamma [Rhodoferax lacus]
MPQAPSTPQPTLYPPGFMVLHGNRLEDLRELLVYVLKHQPLPVLQAETILVQSNGMKHWLEMALAEEGALGICAATRMELPGSYLWQVYRQVLGAQAVPPHMPFDKSSLLWRLMRLLPVLASSKPVYAPLLRYLSAGSGVEGDAVAGRRLYQLAQQIADVFDAYQSYRADWLTDWAQGHDLLRGHDGKPVALEEAHAWQAQLWRDIRADVGEALADASRASVHARFMATLQAQVLACKSTGLRPAGVPPRIVVFGISSLSMQTVEALALLGQAAQVLLLVQNPCQYFWGDIVEGHSLLRQQVRQRQQAKPGALRGGAVATGGSAEQHAATHPLLASWGKQGRDYLHLLDGFDQVEAYRGQVSRVDAFVDPATLSETPTQLAQLQSAILNLEPLPAEPLQLHPDDQSITFCTTHSLQREVEVLHDTLLSWFEMDAALQPRDVMVMVPDMEAFAPHIHAVFGRFARGQARHIPYSVADTTARQAPLVQALEQLLNLPRARVSLVDWLGLFEVAAVRQRFGLSPSDITQLQGWLSTAGVRWGLDAQHRQRWGIPQAVADRDQNTWAFGLRRLLLGYAVGNGDAWGATLPQAAIRSLDASLVSNLLAWVDAITLTLQELDGDKTPEQWCATLAQVVERFFEASDDADERLIQRLLEPLEAWQQACFDAQLEMPLALDVVREHWLSQISESGLQQRFFGGGVQFGTLMPMRSIPFAAICLLGMNDGDYPRQTAPRDFDLMAHSWRAGDRSRREDDRYLFLEALLSARERLFISWQGHRATDNTEQPPSVLVAQLMDHLNTGWTPQRVAQAQPLQAYSEVYFLEKSKFQTFDNEWARLHGGALAAPLQEGAKGGMAGVVEPPQALTVDDLRQLLRQPVEVFLRARLRIRFDEVEEAQQELEPFSLHGLEKYQVGQSLLNAPDSTRALSALKLSGQLPLAAFGERQSAALARELEVVLERRTPWRETFAFESPAVSIDLNINGMPITGTLNGLWSAQDPAALQAQGAGFDAAASPSPLRPVPNADVVKRSPIEASPLLQISQRLGAVLEGGSKDPSARGHIIASLWANHLVACASGIRLTSVQMGLDGQVVLEPLAPPEAIGILATLVDAYQQAWLRPLPVACKTAWAYLQAEAKNARLAREQPEKPEKQKDPHEAAQGVFDDVIKGACERSKSPYLSRAFESYQDLEDELPHWAQALYGALFAQARVTADAAAQNAEEEEA